ncbi:MULTISPECIES: L,D-transpeptidase [Corynebacterium]|jgi:lipoprotein-anchoring transpeptidase ErfK/SrfK|uniref:L,D-transpeptidase LppS n=1 Tax=Corynebacterium provencense TaxID=1737425 RepID=A0A2Z3YXD3_9CORY|nr:MULTISPECIES: Ig-like domain-containing protein [Corynebacterium]AWT26737.1 Putative L,D-transpeptidase LppS [Corynebacterium provencense]MCI1257268.1 Ig-like domain-containing protein [Corynebacterium provencense]
MQYHPGRIFRSILAAAGAAALLATTACTIDKGNDGGVGNVASTTTSTPVTDELVSSVSDGATGVKVDSPVTVTDGDGLDDVTLVDAAGTEVAGTFSEDRTKWTSAEPLEYSSSYSLSASAGDDELNQTFTSFSPDLLTDGALAPLDGVTVGIGQTVALRFDEIPSDREAVEKAITVETEPHVEGAFYWITSQEVRWRPENYWAPGTTVHVKADLYGKDLGDGMYGQQNREATFTIGDDVRVEADDRTKQVVVTKNGEVVRTMPTSMGMPGHETPVGVYTIGDQYDTLMMDSTTYGLALDAGGYQTQVAYATQMSYSGIYLHAAPWSVWAQGNTDTSHGCLNLSVEDAKWVYDNLRRGDIVTVKNTGAETLSGSDGLGDWNIPWSTWSQGNANG